MPRRPLANTLSASTAELTAPAAPRARPAATAAILKRRPEGARLYLVMGGAAIVIAALSLLIPSTPSYDPWAWIVWGREIVHLKLHTTGGPSWKPLPVIFTTVFSVFGRAAPDLWLVVARAGALMAVLMTFKLAVRLTRGLVGEMPDGSRVRVYAPVLLAGLVAAASLVNSRGFVTDNALGYSEGLMTALVLMAFDSHLDGRRRQAFAIGFAAALDRPELWFMWGPYGIYLWWKDPGARKLVLSLFALIPVLWFLPELWGSGHLFRGVTRAQHPRSNSPAFASCPFCTELNKHAWPTVMLRVKAVGLVAMAVAAVGLWMTRASWWCRSPTPTGAVARLGLLAAGIVGYGWWVGIALETQAGFSGNDRYLVLGTALVAVSGGVGWGWGAHGVGRLLERFELGSTARSATGAVGALVAVIVLLATPPWIGPSIIDVPATHRALVYQARLRSDLTKAVAEAGGAARILRCGSVMTEGFQVPMVAWNLGVHTLQIEASPTGSQLPAPPNVIFQARAQSKSRLLPVIGPWERPPFNVHYQLVAHTRTYRMFASCAGGVTL